LSQAVTRFCTWAKSKPETIAPPMKKTSPITSQAGRSVAM
jgi:hypothetical protein